MAFRHVTRNGKEYIAHRPQAFGRCVMASSGHPFATQAAMRILEKGGNAIDAGVASGICINVLLADFTSFLGVAPIIVYLKKENRVVSIDGLGRWPKAASAEWFRANCGGEIPHGVKRTVTPAAADAWLTALERYGTMRFADVAGDAIALAEKGFSMFPVLYDHLSEMSDSYSRFEETRKIYFRDGEVKPVGEMIYLTDLAETMKRMARAEEAASGRGRAAGVRAARDEIFRGETARRIVDYVQENGGLLTMADLEDAGVKEEGPVSTRYHGCDVYACGPWSQGPVIPATLNLLETCEMEALGHNSPEYLHRFLTAMNLSFADRERYYGDPDFVEVPLEGILSRSYAEERAKLLARADAFGEMAPAGDPWAHQEAASGGENGAPPRPQAAVPIGEPGEPAQDTSYCTVIDGEGNAFSATPSDPSHDTPFIPGVGCTVSSRGSQGWLEEGHPSAVAPRKRPRLTPNPALALRDGEIFMTFGTPGGDVQPQAMLQVFLNIVDFGMLPQVAVEAPRVTSYNFPNSFWPHAYNPGRTIAEERICRESGEALRGRGYKLEEVPDFARMLGSVCCIVRDPESGVLMGGADARRASHAAGW